MTMVTSFKAPFGKIPELRLQLVPRWSIVSMSRNQSVAEHSFNVAMITNYIGFKIGYTEPDVNNLVRDALYHDHDEIYTGDIPSPSKNHEGVINIVKLADLIESYRFAAQYCNDTREVKRWLLNGLITKINKLGVDLGIKYNVYSPLLEEVR